MSEMSRPHPPLPSPDHEHHDALLVAQLAAGDSLEEPQWQEATQLVASCPTCAALASDLQIISRAVSQEPVPPRRRDFRLSPEQAERLQGRGLGRLLRRFSLPRARAFQPAAAGLLSVGLVFVVAGYAWPDDGSVSVAPESNAVAPLVEQRSSPPAPSPLLGVLATPSTANDDAFFDSSVGESGLLAPDEAFLEEASEHQGGTSARSTQKSLGADDAEAMEREMLAAPEAPAARVDLAEEPEAGFADAVAPADLKAAAELEPDLTAAQEADGAAANVIGPSGPKATDAEMSLEDDSSAVTFMVLLGAALAVAGGLLLLLSWLSRRAADPLLR